MDQRRRRNQINELELRKRSFSERIAGRLRLPFCTLLILTSKSHANYKNKANEKNIERNLTAAAMGEPYSERNPDGHRNQFAAKRRRREKQLGRTEEDAKQDGE